MCLEFRRGSSARLALSFWAVIFVACPSISFAAPPDAKAVFPAGVARGESVTVRVIGKVGDAKDVWCSRDDVSIAPAEKAGEFTVEVPADAPPGICEFRWFSSEGASALRPFQIGVVPEITETEANNETSNATAVSLPVTVNAVLEKGADVDVFAVSLTAGRTFIASIESHRAFGSPMDGVMQILSPAGFVLEQNDDHHAFDPRIVFSVPADGTYFVRVFAFPVQPNSTIAMAAGAEYIYRLTLTDGPFVDHPVPLIPNAGDSFAAKLIGWNLSDEQSSVTLETPPVLPGSFLFDRKTTVEPSAESFVEETAGEREALPLPCRVTGHISRPGEVDTYRFDGTKGQRAEISVTAIAFDSPLDPVLSLYGPDDKLIRTLDDISRTEFDVRHVQALPADGRYRLEVTDRFGHAGPDYVYLLTVGNETPSFSPTLSADRFSEAAGAELVVDITVGRDSGFKDAVTFSLDPPLPDVVCEAVESAGEGDTAKTVKLKLLPSAEATYNGPLRIIGRSAEGQERPVTAATGIGNGKTADLWVTITPKK